MALPLPPASTARTPAQRRHGWHGLVAAGVAAALMVGCATLPPPPDKPVVRAIAAEQAAQTPLGRALADAARAHPRLTGLVPLPSGDAAFDIRLRLVDVAERTVDLQTYIFKPDAAGLLMAERLLAAADRGVRVRLLIDDNGTAGLDPVIALLDAHPAVEVRLFNPFANRGLRLPELLRDLKRLNSRMHAKSMIVDGQVAIMGGRNIGDAYADRAEVNFTDLDMLAVGALLPRAGAAFDRYWNGVQTYPAAALVAPARAWTPARLHAERARAQQAAQRPAAAAVGSPPGTHDDTADAARLPPSTPAPVASAALIDDLLHGRLEATWAPAALWTDDPDLDDLDPDDPLPAAGRLAPRLRAAFAAATTQLDVVSPYFVPDEETSTLLQALAGRGVHVRVLTNSLAATDVAAVHSGYQRHREELLRAGVALYELRPVAAAAAAPRAPRFGFGGSLTGSSLASLHAKAFAVDRQRLFVGSFNLDPRSTRHNDELVLAMASPTLADQLSSALDQGLEAIAWRLALTADGALRWHHGDAVADREPEAGWGRRALAALLALFDIDWLL